MRMRALALATTPWPPRWSAHDDGRDRGASGTPGVVGYVTADSRYGGQSVSGPRAPGPQGPARGAAAGRHVARMRPQLLRHAAPPRPSISGATTVRLGTAAATMARLPPVQVVSASRRCLHIAAEGLSHLWRRVIV